MIILFRPNVVRDENYAPAVQKEEVLYPRDFQTMFETHFTDLDATRVRKERCDQPPNPYGSLLGLYVLSPESLLRLTEFPS